MFCQVLAAKKFKTIKIVTPEWLWTCADRWEHADERDFPLNSKTVVQRKPRALSTSQDLLQSDAGAKEETKEILNPPTTTCVYDRVTGKRIGKFLAKENREGKTWAAMRNDGTILS